MHPIQHHRLAILCVSFVALALPALAGGAPRPAAKGAAGVDGARIAAADTEPQNWLAHGTHLRRAALQPAAADQ